ncbi:MAG: hypothetical protein PUA90_00340 [bacterium]|nr:hypothetical protein [bacterium]
MEEKILKMIINYVLGVYEDDKKSIESCIEVNTLFINMMKNEETKLDRLLDGFPKTHPVSVLYSEIRDREDLLQLLEKSKEIFEKTDVDNECLKSFEDDKDVEEMCKKLFK